MNVLDNQDKKQQIIEKIGLMRILSIAYIPHHHIHSLIHSIH